jgi:glutamate-ammonia-ligase adenylyltransferase
VTSLDRFINYHDKEADLWERQALLRGRVVYGPATLARRIHSELQRLVYTSGLSESGIREIAELRDKVIADREIDEELRLNFKVGRGGIADLETIVQVLQLAHGHSNELLRAACSTGDTLAVLREEGLLDRADAERLEAAYVFLRRLESGLRLDQDKSVEDVERDARLLGPVAYRMGFTGPSASADLLTEVDARRALVSEIYARQLVGDPSSR